MRSPKALVAIAAGLSLAFAAAGCGDDGGSAGGGLEEGGGGTSGSGGTGGRGGTTGSGGNGGSIGSPACKLTDLTSEDCVACVGQSAFACPQVAFGCFLGSGELLTCAGDNGCVTPGGQPPVDVACLLGNCTAEFAAVNFCLSGCPQYVDCFR